MEGPHPCLHSHSSSGVCGRLPLAPIQIVGAIMIFPAFGGGEIRKNFLEQFLVFGEDGGDFGRGMFVREPTIRLFLARGEDWFRVDRRGPRRTQGWDHSTNLMSSSSLGSSNCAWSSMRSSSGQHSSIANGESIWTAVRMGRVSGRRYTTTRGRPKPHASAAICICWMLARLSLVRTQMHVPATWDAIGL